MKVLRKGRRAWNDWRKKNPEIIPDLTHEVLDNFDLSKHNLAGAQLTHAWIRNADLSDADLTDADLYDVNANFAKLSGANLWNANCGVLRLARADLTGADLRHANLAYADLYGTTLTRAFMDQTVLAGTSLSHAIGLETIVHHGASSIGIDTFFFSGGLPEVFLRGCGVPDAFIEYAGSLIGKPIEYYSCFISYSSADEEFARRLYADLQARRIRTWFAPEDLKIGDRFRSRIDESIRAHDKLVLILSERSIDSSWVEKEVETAYARERREKRSDIFFPIRLDDAVMETDRAWAADIVNTRHIGDFRLWKSHDDYTKSLERLVRDLKRSQPPVVMT
ncbi:MAG TPA: toll/interleukin-1 receptor domain-containing protein [Thermoanaerobaculia bacterium]|nr:toll/interleukin-1 receptor domain-containing protein [Thermoanaerobaculia bacterium]